MSGAGWWWFLAWAISSYGWWQARKGWKSASDFWREMLDENIRLRAELDAERGRT